MATVNPDSTTTSLPVQVSFTQQGVTCAQPALIEALVSANWRLDLPNSIVNPAQTPFTASTLDGNIFRIDSTGAGYVPGTTKVELAEQVITLSETDGPGDIQEMIFSSPTVTGLENVSPSIFYEITPADAAVNVGPLRDVGAELRVTVTRVNIGGSPPYPVIIVRGRGRLFIIPSPEPA